MKRERDICIYICIYTYVLIDDLRGQESRSDGAPVPAGPLRLVKKPLDAESNMLSAPDVSLKTRVVMVWTLFWDGGWYGAP